MRVAVDETLCAATGQCEMICPEVFEVEMISVVKTPEPDPSLQGRAREAADNCPTGAISIAT